jgi:uncharacterized membrane protein
VEFQQVVTVVGLGIDAVGVVAIVVGTIAATVVAVVQLSRHEADVYRTYRRRIGRSILLGLEFLIAGDIIRTVAVTPTFTNVGVLAAIVAIRSLLSFTLELEVTGRPPWQKAENSRSSPQSSTAGP